jgi:hypothetical protein
MPIRFSRCRRDALAEDARLLATVRFAMSPTACVTDQHAAAPAMAESDVAILTAAGCPTAFWQPIPQIRSRMLELCVGCPVISPTGDSGMSGRHDKARRIVEALDGLRERNETEPNTSSNKRVVAIGVGPKQRSTK